ncbi:hypothetical protein [Paenibacillus lautus]|uniref:hypothetical protein n=1 Tax=Paenibacillus lautus TaxID=1401 RepID=UPI003D26B0D1
MHHTDRVRSRVQDGILIRGLDSAVYLVEHSKKRPIGDMVTFHSYGFNAKGIVVLDELALEGMEIGSPVNICGDFIMNSPETLLPEKEKAILLRGTQFDRYEKLADTEGTGKKREIGVFLKSSYDYASSI